MNKQSTDNSAKNSSRDRASKDAFRQMKARFDLARSKADINQVTSLENLRLLSANPEYSKFFMDSVVSLFSDDKNDIRCRVLYVEHIKTLCSKKKKDSDIYVQHLTDLTLVDSIMLDLSFFNMSQAISDVMKRNAANSSKNERPQKPKL